MSYGLSPASIRNVMNSLEKLGYLISPHKSAGRIPSDAGLRLFVDGLLEIGSLNNNDKMQLDKIYNNQEGSFYDEALKSLSGLSGCASLIAVPKTKVAFKHVELISMAKNKALLVIVTEDGNVENRLVDIPCGVTPSSLKEASNYLNERLNNKTINEVKDDIIKELNEHKSDLNELSEKIVNAGLGSFVDNDNKGYLILKGQANLLEDLSLIEDVEKIKNLFSMLEVKENISNLIDLTNSANGVQIFIGSETNLFASSGCSLVSAPYLNSKGKIVGAIGVIGPTRVNYARIIPVVNYTAYVISKIIGN
ncbi:MAG: Heat-inducible transcription repressor HrcA [Alphaproteobacteria bacterium ADurb.Bin438]|nr:MAG: Heat-inducible transcription repressor HrcA [Alphaproteobacteria bacterium ADurb.Bin438]